MLDLRSPHRITRALQWPALRLEEGAALLPLFSKPLSHVDTKIKLKKIK
jgi:hypothetical protein